MLLLVGSGGSNYSIYQALLSGSKAIGDSEDEIPEPIARNAVLRLYLKGMHVRSEERVRQLFHAWEFDPPTALELDRNGHIGKDGGGKLGGRTRDIVPTRVHASPEDACDRMHRAIYACTTTLLNVR